MEISILTTAGVIFTGSLLSASGKPATDDAEVAHLMGLAKIKMDATSVIGPNMNYGLLVGNTTIRHDEVVSHTKH